jgi:hypothetical protein
MKNKIMLLCLLLMMLVVPNIRGAEVEMTSFATVAAIMDDYISYSTEKGGGTANPAVYSEQIRLYQNSEGTGGGTITLEAKNGATITEVSIGSAMTTQIRWQVGESMDSVSIDLAKNEPATLSGLSANSVTCHCWGTTSRTRLYVNYLKVVYEIDENTTPDEGEDTPTEPQDEYWELVTDVTSLVLDDQVVIVAKDIACALGADRGTNRAQASVVKTDNRITLSEDVQILTLEPGTKEGTYAFSTDSGYLYAASSIANQLKTKVEKDDNGSWTIAITDDIATIKAQGTNERNWLRFNSSASVFSCYSSGQGDVLLYKYIVPGGVVSRPTISGDSIEFVHSTMVTIAAADSLDIYYTIDGSDPIAQQSIKYTGAFTLTEDVLVKAIAYNATTDKSSKMVSQQFYKIPTITCAEASAIALAVSGDGVLTERTYRIVAYVTGNVEPVSSGQQVFDVADTADGESVFMSYYCQVPEGGVEIGMKVEMIGKLTKYNGVAEMKYGVVTILEGVPTMLYFIPNSNWKMADARFAAYLYGSTNTGIWVDMQLVDAEEGVYSFVVDKSQYDHVIFMRMNPATSENIWGNDWNRSADIVIPQDLNCATMMEDSWDGEVVWSNYGEDYVDVLEIEIANLATEEVEADGVTYLQLSGSDDVLGMNWLLFLSNYTGENKEYALDLENYYIGTDGIELTLLSGTLTKSTDVEKGDVFTGRIVASYDTETYVFDLTMYYQATSPILIKIENANVAIDEYNILKMTGNWLNEADGITYPVLVEVPEYNIGATEPYNVPVTITVGGWGDEDPWLGFAEGEATIIVVDSVVTLTGVLTNSWLGLTFDITISGSLKGENVEELQTDTIYFVNMQYWNSVYVYAWNEEIGSVNAAWPGVAAANANYQVNGYDVYYFVANQGQYTHCIFNNSNAQTDNLQWTAGKYYYNGSWWTYDELMNNVVQSTYTVAGSSGLLGTHWDVADTTNNMTLLEDGIYQLIKTDLSLVAGTYEYKVVRDHSWDWCRPSGPNQVLSIDKDGIYTVTFTLDLSIETISATAELQQEAVVIPKVFLIGTMNDWDYTATELQLDSDSLTASVTVMLNANTTYDYQMVVDGNWFTSYDGMMTRDNSQNWQFEHIESSTIYASISTDIAGEYTFVWNYADNTVSVIYPDICSAVKELDWYNGVKVSQLQSSVWHKIDIASITEYATLTHIAIENDLWDQVNVSVEYYTSCDGFKIMQGEARFPVGVTNMELNFDEITKYIVYMPNIDGIYLKVSVEEVGYAFAWFEDFVCDGSVYVDPITGEAHVIMSSVPSSLYWEDVVQVHSTLDSIYTFYINPIVAPKTLDEYALKQIGAMPHLVAGQPVDTTGTAEAIMAYYQSIDRETVADVVRVEWVEGANDIVPCDADYYYMTLLIETACEENMIMNYEFPIAYVDVEEIIVEACGSYDWNGVTYTESGAYYLKNEDGCVVGILNLTILPIDDEITIETICYGETFLWEANGEEYTETTYLEIVKENEYGCAVTYILDLTVSTAPVVYTDSATICYGDYYAWIDGYYDETGVYETVISNEDGCDSIIATLHLTVLPEVPETIIEETICYDDVYTWYGKQYHQSGEYSITLQDVNGCDSIVTLDLTVLPEVEETIETAIICAGDTYTWQGVSYAKSGDYSIRLQDVNGCDSVVTLELTVLPEVEIYEETVDLCYGEAYVWVDGKLYTEAGTYEIITTNILGCDSIIEILNIKVSSAPVYQEYTATICYGDSYEWIDGYYDETGVYETVIYNDYYCDSIIATLHLTVLPEVPETIEEITIYDGEEYMWHDEIYTEEGEYSITLQDINGCDSVVILHLTVKPIYEDEWALLKEIREDLITNNAWQTPWDVSTSVSSWRGVELYNGHVIEIDLSSQGLMGTFPTKILQLPHLEYLSLADNQLTGDAFAKIQTDMTTFVATNPTFVSALIYLDISYNQFTGNVGIITAMSKLMPNLSTLQANNNRLKDVVPMIPKKIHVDLSEQDINHYVHLDLSNLNVDPMQLPTILLYDHLGQTYFTSPVAIDITNYSPNYTYKHDDPWGIMIDKTNDYLTCLNGEAYRGKNGDTLYLSYPYADVSRDSYCRMTLSFEMGDANFVDGVNVADLQSTILYAFGGYNNCAFNLTAADTYTDNRINVQDVIRTVDILLAKADINTDSTTIRHIVSQARAVSYDVEIVVENNTIKLITNQPIAALQISAIGDVQWLLNGIGMEQTTAHQSVVAYSLAGNYIPAGETIIGYCQGNVEITQAELSDAEARMVAVSISGKRTPTEMENIEQTTSEQLIYDVLGRKHDSMQQQGLYIIKSNNQYIKVYNHQ